VVSMMDADSAGRRAESDLYEMFPTLEVVELPAYAKDPGEVQQGLESIYMNRYLYIEREIIRL
jgi:hypothetical protein